MIYAGYSIIFFWYFYSHFLGPQIYKLNILAINSAYIKGINKGEIAGRYLEGKIARGRISHGQASY